MRFSAQPTAVKAGEFTTLSWQTAGATSVVSEPNLNDEDDGPELPMSGTRTVILQHTTSYRLTATGTGGTTSASVSITVVSAAPTVSLTAVPASIITGQSAALTWSSEGATSILLEPNGGTFTSSTGSVTVSPAATTTYTATATGPGGTSTASATVTVAPVGEMAVTLSASPSSVAAGGHSTLTWTSQNAAAVRIDPSVGAVNNAGSVTVAPPATTTYVATATSAGGSSVTSAATVTVLGGPAAGLKNLEHIIFFIQENRSFDNYFSSLHQYRANRGVGGEIDAMDLSLPQRDYFGHDVKPFHQRTMRTELLSPAWNESHFYAKYQSGAFQMTGWMMQPTPSIPSGIDPHYTRTMGYYECGDIPFYCELATQFATSDRFFSSVMSGTNTNRAFLFSASSGGMIRPSDPFPASLPTIFRRLSEAGISWRYYYQDGSVFLANYTRAGGCPECDWDRYQQRVWSINNYYEILARPTADRDLPQVIFIQHSSGERGPETALDEHPSHNIQKGAAQAEKIIRALMNSSAWHTSVFIESYDEAGGLYDHVAPYAVANPDGISPLWKATDGGRYDDFTYSGFRVPLLVVSPWAKPNFVSHRNREFTSILKLIETRFGLEPLTRRDAEADDMTEFFDFSEPHWLSPPPLPAQPTSGVDDIRLEAEPNHPH